MASDEDGDGLSLKKKCTQPPQHVARRHDACRRVRDRNEQFSARRTGASAAGSAGQWQTPNIVVHHG